MPSCKNCGDSFAPARADLGYRTCLDCGQIEAKSVKFAAIPMHKSNYVCVTNPAELIALNPKHHAGG